MGKLRLSLFVVGLAACGSNNNQMVDAKIIIPDAAPDAKVFMDAAPPVYDFSCLNNGAPAAPGGTITVSGTFNDVSYNGNIVQTPLATAPISVCLVGAANCVGATNLLGTATSDGTGAFTSTAIPATNPVDAFVRATSDHCSVTTTQTCVTSTTCPATETCVHERPIDEYPPAPLVANLTGLPLITFTNTNLALLELAAQVTQSPSKGILGVAVVDCSATPQPVSGATITVKQGGNDVTGTTVLDGSAFGMGGGAIIFNVPPGSGTTEVGATYMGMTFRTHSVTISTTATVATAVKPGY